MREETVAKKNAKIATRIAATNRCENAVNVPNACGITVSNAMTQIAPITVVEKRRSCDVREGTSDSEALFRICAVPTRKLSAMVGMLRMSVMIPAAATAPAPM